MSMFAQVDLRHMDEQAGSNVVSVGVDLSEFYMSVEWDILEVPAVRWVEKYTTDDKLIDSPILASVCRKYNELRIRLFKVIWPITTCIAS